MLSSPFLDYRKIPGKGLGIIAKVDIPSDEPLDRSPAIEYDASTRDFLSITDLGPMDWVDPEQFDPERPNKPCRGRTLYGPATQCNHSSHSPNAAVRWEWDEDGQLWGKLVATAPIPAGQEVLVRYTDFVAYQDTERWVA